MAYNTNTASDVVAGTDATATEYNDMRATVLNGWYNITDTITYSSANTNPTSYVVTVPSDGTTFYQVGQKVRLKQGGSFKYFYIIAVTSTTLTLCGGDDFTVANSGITNFGVSSADSPYGFPNWIGYTPQITGITVGNGTLTGRFSISGRVVNADIVFNAGTTSSYSGNYRFGIPIASANSESGGHLNSGSAYYQTGGSTRLGWCGFSPGSILMDFYDSTISGSGPPSWTSAFPFGGSTNTQLTAQIAYRI